MISSLVSDKRDCRADLFRPLLARLCRRAAKHFSGCCRVGQIPAPGGADDQSFPPGPDAGGRSILNELPFRAHAGAETPMALYLSRLWPKYEFSFGLQGEIEMGATEWGEGRDEVEN